MPKQEKRDERREHQRFKVKPGGIAVLTPRWPRSTVVGDILDISKGGAAMKYVADEAPPRDPCELTMANTNPRFFLHKIPIVAVTDIPMTTIPFGAMQPRRLGVQFGKLTAEQTADIEGFIDNHATVMV